MALLNTTVARTFRRLLAAGFALVLATSAPIATWAQQTVTPSPRVTRNVVVRAAPSTTTLPLARLLPGETLPLISDEPDWYRVGLPDGREGFVSKGWTDLAGAQLLAAGKSFKVHVIDVGTGLAIFVEGEDFALLYDAGSQDDLASVADNRVVAYIKAVRPNLRVLNHVILSHPHKDHLELMPDVFDAFQVENVWESGRVNSTAGYCKFLQKVVGESGVVYHDALASNAVRTAGFKGKTCGGGIQVTEGPMMTAAPVVLGGQAQMTLLYRDAHNYTDPNGNTVVVRLDLGGHRILLAGDAEGGERVAPTTPPQANSIEAKLIACCRADLAAEVLVVGHHGSLTSSRTAFLDAVGAKLFVISSGPHPYQSVILPDPAIVKMLKARDGKVYRTDRDDATCAADPAKPGPDADESPGGCDNVLITISPTAPIVIDYFKPVD